MQYKYVLGIKKAPSNRFFHIPFFKKKEIMPKTVKVTGTIEADSEKDAKSHLSRFIKNNFPEMEVLKFQ
jgi:hypothetical protein